MSKKFNLFFIFLLSLNIPLLSGCDNSENFNENYSIGTSESAENKLILSDYSLPDTFAMTLMLSDTSIFNKGDPWYYKTAKICDDWQVIEYDRDLEDRTKQETHFFKYLSEDTYTNYMYDYSKSDWTKLETGSFNDMVLISMNNFKFIDTPPSGPNIHLVETDTNFDTNSTSIVANIDAKRYEYTNVLDYEIIFDAAYSNLCLSECVKDGSTVCTEWTAHDYCTTVTEWNSTYLTSKNYKLAPGLAESI